MTDDRSTRTIPHRRPRRRFGWLRRLSGRAGLWLLGGLQQWALRRVWYLHPPVVVMIRATPPMCLHTLATAAKPSTQRLHLRNLFANGRRYAIQPTSFGKYNGFRLTTTSRIFWRYRGRTSSSAVMNGMFSSFGDDITRIHLQSRVGIGYLLNSLLVPAGMTAILWYVPWPSGAIISALGVVYILSWLGHRFNAALEANEMIWFVEKALEDLVPAEVVTLGAESPDVIYDSRDFPSAWEKFYAEHKGE